MALVPCLMLLMMQTAHSSAPAAGHLDGIYCFVHAMHDRSNSRAANNTPVQCTL